MLESIIFADSDEIDVLFDLSPAHYLLIFLVIIVAAFILILLLPAILELRKPKDAGPRRIDEDEEES
jgi:hypothetical protein